MTPGNNQTFSTLVGTVLPIIGAILALAMAFLAARTAWRLYRRLQFQKAYPVELPRSVRVVAAREDVDSAWFVLRPPQWRHPKADGTRDRRHRDNALRTRTSELHIGRFIASSKDMTDLYQVVRSLRSHEQIILDSPEEQRKRRLLQDRDLILEAQTTIEGLLARYGDDPTGFEHWCAALLRQQGFQVEVTPPSRDGGFDLRMWRGGFSYIAECKLYSPDSLISRPLVQKLVGANATEHADSLVFITTSTFTSDARAYAHSVPVELIDGTMLASMSSSRTPVVPWLMADPLAFQLTDAELRDLLPADAR